MSVHPVNHSPSFLSNFVISVRRLVHFFCSSLSFKDSLSLAKYILFSFFIPLHETLLEVFQNIEYRISRKGGKQLTMDTSKVFSTGQSWQDLMDLANLAAMLPTEPPPVLTDKDYVPKDWGLAMTIAYAGTAGLACLFMLIRSIARAKNANFGVEDGLVIVALVCRIMVRRMFHFP